MADYLESEQYRTDSAEIVQQLRIARERKAFEAPDIRSAVTKCAANARRAGCAPERLLVALKQLVADDALADVNDWFRSVMTDRIVSWAIQAYFETDTRPPG